MPLHRFGISAPPESYVSQVGPYRGTLNPITTPNEDIITNAPIASRLQMEDTYVIAAGATLVPSEGRQIEAAELAGTSGDES
jgi:hypothetical protein